MTLRKTILAGVLAAAAATPLAAQEPVKIGMITTLSGPAGYLGQDIRDGFQLAIDAEDGKLGGVPVELMVEDDSLKPGNGRQIADRYLNNEGVKLFTGIVFSNVAGATVPDIVDAGAFYISPNAAPSNFAGKECNENYFVVSWQNDSLQFHPGGLGIAFLRQYQQAGLLETVPMVVAEPSMDAGILNAVGDAAKGVNVSSHWNTDFENSANEAFVAAWKEAYGRPLTYYASQGYDAARAIAAALKATGGSVDDADAFRNAMREAAFESVRGDFAFGPNQHPVQDWFSLKVVDGEDGKPALKTVGTVFEDHGDVYAAECSL